MTQAGPDWERSEGALRRTVRLASHRDAVATIVRLSEVFEEHQHHADLSLSWRTLTLELTTHDQGGVVTDADHAMAHRIDAVLATAPVG